MIAAPGSAMLAGPGSAMIAAPGSAINDEPGSAHIVGKAELQNAFCRTVWSSM